MAPKTPKGQTRNQVFHYVRQRLLDGSPPTVREVQQAFGFRSVQTAQGHLDNLVAEGRLVKRPGQARSYGLPPGAASDRNRRIPIVGRVQAGTLTAAVETAEGLLDVHGYGESDALFALRVQGDSMVNAGIFPGDIVVVRRQSVARSGDIVVALVGDEATVKRLRMVNGVPQLHPENEAYDPIVFRDGEEVHLLGKVVEVRRYLEW